jgi:hypothetical protein
MISKSISKTFRLIVASIVIGLFLSVPLIGQQVKIVVKCDPPSDQTTKDLAGKLQNKKPTERSKNFAPQFEPDKQLTVRPKKENQLVEDTIIPVGCTGSGWVNILPPGAPPNQTFVFTVSQTTTPNLVGFRWNSNDPLTSTLQVPVTTGANGLGTSNLFQVKGLLPGITTMTAHHPSFVSQDSDIIVPECACPTIVNSPPVRTP